MPIMKFSELPYSRPDITALTEELRRLTAAIARQDADADTALSVFLESSRVSEEFETMYTIAYIRNTIDTTDAFYDGEISFYNETLPVLELELTKFREALLASPHLPLLKEKYGELYFRRLEEKKKLIKEENVENQIEENHLVQEYSRAAAAASTEFHGETVNFYGLLKKMQDPDRSLRREALTAWSDLYQSVAGQLDDIYSRMVENRLKQAETLGFNSYEDMIFLQMERFDYTREDIDRFRENIVRYVVPVVSDIYENRRRTLKLDQLHYYDEFLTDPAGNICPQGSVPELLAEAQKMYRELSPETGEYFDQMMDRAMFDLQTRPGKHQGGYCTFLPTLGLPFIFSNFNGTTADIDVLTHEAGHGFEAWLAHRTGLLYDITFSTAEVDEIHSMSMELYTYPWMERFFGGSREKADCYRRDHFQGCLTVIPYMACVDEFQEKVYAGRLTDAGDRYNLWRRLEQKYMPWRSYDGIGFLEKGGFWLQKQHIFMFPFYYIDYALAQFCALQYYFQAEEDREKAWSAYLRLCRAGGSMPYLQLLQLGGLDCPLEESTIAALMEKIRGKVVLS